MRNLIFTAAVASVLSLGALPANAMTAQPVPLATGTPQVTLVAGGCGIGFHRGPYGGCRPNFYRAYRGPYRFYGWRHRGWRRWR